MSESYRDRWLRMTPAERAAVVPSGRTCIEPGCGKPAGTPWGPYWCPDCDDVRIERITRVSNLDLVLAHATHAELERARVCFRACAGIPDPEAALRAAREQLREIAAKKGPFSRDPHEHAQNCIEYMAKCARAALSMLTPKEPT